MPASEKREIRRAVRRLFPGQKAREQESRELCRQVIMWKAYDSAGVIGGYVPMAHEADVTAVLLDALALGKVLALPRCGEPPEMTFHRVNSLEELVPGAYGLLEPPTDAPVLHPAEIDLLLTPLEALNREGARLGKGGGYYDRFLERFHGIALGVALSHQWVEALPAEPWDRPLNAAVDKDGIYMF